MHRNGWWGAGLVLEAIAAEPLPEPNSIMNSTQNRQVYLTPEKRMYASIIAGAIADLHMTTRGRRSITNQREARKWLESDSIHMCSFIWICQFLELEPDYIRARVGLNVSRTGGIGMKNAYTLHGHGR